MPALKRLLSLLLPSVLLSCLTATSEATTVVRMGLQEMTASSTSIVHGTVVGIESRWNEDATMIVTDVSVQVAESLKGDRAGVVVVTQPGGTLDGLRTEVPGASAFELGDEVVLFLAPDPSRQMRINGLFQGRLQVTADPKTGKKLIRGMPLDARAFLSPSSSGGVADLPPSADRPVSLDRFLGDLRQLVEEINRTEGK